MRKRKRTALLVEPPSSATGDIAFNLIVFFLVCASVQPDSGVKQSIPSSETVEKESEEAKNIEVSLTRNTVAINGIPVAQKDFVLQLQRKLEGKTNPEDRVVVVKSKPDTPYFHWIAVTSAIEQAGGVVTLQMEEERTIQVPN
ncbi:MAG: biopolymer transporter ExbD [Planctomycetaceae bacterium]|nr:biopolymer transporter ExbD [Planctomycetaceae bacterium]